MITVGRGQLDTWNIPAFVSCLAVLSTITEAVTISNSFAAQASNASCFSRSYECRSYTAVTPGSTWFSRLACPGCPARC
jgi:hypothetical protein